VTPPATQWTPTRSTWCGESIGASGTTYDLAEVARRRWWRHDRAPVRAAGDGNPWPAQPSTAWATWSRHGANTAKKRGRNDS
jgi:hypothetical protein